MNAGQFFSVLWAVSLVALIAGSVVAQQDLMWFKSLVRGWNVVAGTLLVVATLACVWISSGLDVSVSS